MVLNRRSLGNGQQMGSDASFHSMISIPTGETGLIRYGGYASRVESQLGKNQHNLFIHFIHSVRPFL